MTDAICSIQGCECPTFARGWCQAHYGRWNRNGDPTVGRYVHRCSPRLCSLPDCSRKHYGKGYCELHYLRWVNSGGDQGVVQLLGRRSGVLNSAWRADDVGYEGVHLRLTRALGPASSHACSECGQSADDWSYDHGCPDEKTIERRGRTYVYSTDPTRYVPLCRSCHTRFDKGIEAMSLS